MPFRKIEKFGNENGLSSFSRRGGISTYRNGRRRLRRAELLRRYRAHQFVADDVAVTDYRRVFIPARLSDNPYRGRRLKSLRVLLYFRALEGQNCQQIVVKQLARGFHLVAGNQATTVSRDSSSSFGSYLTLFAFPASRD
jgi:hypothetical protein